jgi:hypothetical protein
MLEGVVREDLKEQEGTDEMSVVGERKTKLERFDFMVYEQAISRSSEFCRIVLRIGRRKQ